MNVSLKLAVEQRFPSMDIVRLLLLNPSIVASFSASTVTNLQSLLVQVDESAPTRVGRRRR